MQSKSTDGLAAARGEVFTQQWVADLVLDLAGYTTDIPLYQKTVVEPSAGQGAFLRSIVSRLLATRPSASPWEELSHCIFACDIRRENVDSCRDLAQELLTSAGCPPSTATRVAHQWIIQADFLMHTSETHLVADFVVGNPPYVNLSNIPQDLRRTYRARHPPMNGRSDLFIGFYNHGLDLLDKDGILAFICSDRWMRNSYGQKLRAKIASEGFALDDVLTMHGTHAFESRVSAYPAITIIRKGKPRGTSLMAADANFSQASLAPLLTWRSDQRLSRINAGFTAARMEKWRPTAEPWPQGTPESLHWLSALRAQFSSLEESGVRISIGLATGADCIYLPAELPPVENERLLPMVMALDLQDGHFKWGGKHLVNPWTADGLVSLGEYPQLAAYFTKHRAKLTARNVARRGGVWYRTIDRPKWDILTHDKLVLADLKAHSNPVRVPAGFYPHHNLTALTSTTWNLDVLGGLLLSRVVEKQVAATCVKMNNTTLRFQPTVLRRVVVPTPEGIGPELSESLAEAFHTRDRDLATTAAVAAYGLKNIPSDG